jgi:hypothetical protein
MDHQPCLVKISIVNVSTNQHVSCSIFIFDSFWNLAQVLVQ